MHFAAGIARFFAGPPASPPPGLPLQADPEPPSPWRRIAMRYDVRRITRDGLRCFAGELFAAGHFAAGIARFFAGPPASPPPGLPPQADPEPPSPWRRIAMRYDVRRITRDGLRCFAEELFAAGAISRPDLLLLSLNREVLGQDCPGWEFFETPAEPDGRRDWILEVEMRLARARPNTDYVRYLERLRSVLERAAGSRTSPFASAPVACISDYRPVAGEQAIGLKVSA